MFGGTGRNSFRSVGEAWFTEPIIAELTPARQLLVHNTCTESHENPTDGLVAQPTSRTEGCTGSAVVYFKRNAKNMREIRTNHIILVGKHKWNR
jgi:hypothetical protein